MAPQPKQTNYPIQIIRLEEYLCIPFIFSWMYKGPSLRPMRHLREIAAYTGFALYNPCAARALAIGMTKSANRQSHTPHHIDPDRTNDR